MVLPHQYGGVTSAEVDAEIDAVAAAAAAADAVVAANAAAALTAATDADSFTRNQFADAAGMTFPRTTALFLPGIAANRQRCSFSFDPTNTTDLTIRFKRRGLSRPAASTSYLWAGLGSADRPAIAIKNTAGVYTVELRELSTALASYTWTDDLEEHEWTFTYLSTGVAILLDGVSVATGAAASLLDTSFVFSVGNATTSATVFSGDHAIYRDFEVIDPATATNKVYLRLDEPAGGPYRNAYLTPGDPLYDASNTSGVTIATTGTATQYPSAVTVQTVNGGDRPAPARRLLERTRVAAYSGLGDGASAGEFASVNWAPTGTPAFNVEFNCARSLTQGGDVMIWGRIAADYANINVTAAGVVQARVNTTNICTTTVAALPPDGCVRHVRVEFRDSGADVTAAIYVGRILLASGTLAATQFSAAAVSHRLGATSVSRRWSGIIFDVLIEDLNSQANSGYYLMDEARAATSYANSYSGGTLAALTKNGYVSSCPVASSDGRGRSWQPTDGRPHLVCAYAAAGQAGITGAVNITNDTELTDTQGFFGSSAFTAHAAGFVIATQCGTISGDAALASLVTVGLAIGTTIQGTGLLVGVPALSTGQGYCVRAAFPVAAGDVVRGRISAVSAGTVAHESSYFTLEFYETPASG